MYQYIIPTYTKGYRSHSVSNKHESQVNYFTRLTSQKPQGNILLGWFEHRNHKKQRTFNEKADLCKQLLKIVFCFYLPV